jgi:hypothetical protein
MRWLAIVPAKKVVVQMATKMVMSKVDEREVTSAYFENVEDARSWLLRQK